MTTTDCQTVAAAAAAAAAFDSQQRARQTVVISRDIARLQTGRQTDGQTDDCNIAAAAAADVLY